MPGATPVASLAAAFALLVSTERADGQASWTDLFDHSSLQGWVVRGGHATYTVEHETIVGRAVAGGENTFLCTATEFDDFELDVEYRCDAALNSGVQVRSAVVEDRVRGPQVEIDEDVHRGRCWSGGIYDEGRRGWLDPWDGEKGE